LAQRRNLHRKSAIRCDERPAMEQISILIVDDDENLRRLLESVLLAEGYAVVTAASAEEALAATEAFDLLITDICLPGMDGLKMLQAIKMHRPQVQAIVMTGSTFGESVRDAYEAGACDYRVKPFTMVAMASAVQDVAKKIRKDRHETQLLLAASEPG
jgi:two-component system, response regulator FlrC